MKKLFALFTFVAAVVAMTSCGGSKITGTPIEKTHFTIIQPEGWEVVTNDETDVEIKHQGENVTNFITIKEDTEDYNKALEYYLSPDGGYKKVEEINVEGGKLNVLKKDDRNSYWIIAPQGEKTDDCVKITVNNNKTEGDPLADEEVRAILESIVLK